MGIPPLSGTDVKPRRWSLSVALLLAAAPLAAQGNVTHVLIVTGLSGEPAYAATFKAAADQLVDVARGTWRVADSSLWYLAEDPSKDTVRIRGRATRENIAAAIATLARRTAPGDVVMIVLIGHGNGEGPESRVNVPGPDPAARDYAGWITPFAKQTVVFVVAASASGDFLPVLAGLGRIVITATKAASERNASIFATQFAGGFGTGEADADKDGRISVLEAFAYARAAVRAAYESKQAMLTEHAQLDDNGDGVGSVDPATSSTGDGGMSRQVTFGPPHDRSDPRVAALAAERQYLEAAIAALRARRSTTDSLAFSKELERLLVLLAEKTQAMRVLERGRAP